MHRIWLGATACLRNTEDSLVRPGCLSSWRIDSRPRLTRRVHYAHYGIPSGSTHGYGKAAKAWMKWKGIASLTPRHGKKKLRLNNSSGPRIGRLQDVTRTKRRFKTTAMAARLDRVQGSQGLDGSDGLIITSSSSALLSPSCFPMRSHLWPLGRAAPFNISHHFCPSWATCDVGPVPRRAPDGMSVSDGRFVALVLPHPARPTRPPHNSNPAPRPRCAMLRWLTVSRV